MEELNFIEKKLLNELNNFKTKNPYGFNEDEITNFVEDSNIVNESIFDVFLEKTISKKILKINNENIYPKNLIIEIVTGKVYENNETFD